MSLPGYEGTLLAALMSPKSDVLMSLLGMLLLSEELSGTDFSSGSAKGFSSGATWLEN